MKVKGGGVPKRGSKCRYSLEISQRAVRNATEMYDGQRMIEAGFGLDEEEEQRLDLAPIGAGMMSAEDQAQQARAHCGKKRGCKAGTRQYNQLARHGSSRTVRVA